MHALSRLAFSALALTASVSAQLAGVYTINPVWPAATNNFPSFLDATNALAAQGVSGPVWMLVYDDAGPYHEAAPFVTVNGPYAPNTAVIVFSSWTGSSSTNRVTFLPAPGKFPVLDATGDSMGIFWGGADYVTVQGFEIENAIHDGISLYAEASHGIAQDPIIDRCRIHDCGGTGLTIYGNTPQPTNTLVQNCVFWRLQLTNAGSFSTTGRFGYVTTRRSTGTRIVHNTFLVDTGVGSSICVIGSYPSSTTEVPYAEVSNNVVWKNAAASAPIYRIISPVGTSFPTPIVCDSNCLFDLTGAPMALYGDNGSVTAATLLDWQVNTLRDLASLGVDPMCLDPVAHEFHLQSTSPCIGASSVADGVAFDADGQPRLAPIDIGADEHSDASYSVYGLGCPGTGTLTPTLTTRTWPFLGNQEFSLSTENTPPGALSVLFGSLGTGGGLPLGGGCTVWLDLASATSLAVQLSGPAGSASTLLALPGNPAFVGFDLGYQSLVLDAAAPLGFTLTNALDVIFAF